jgi:hypothetical protein
MPDTSLTDLTNSIIGGMTGGQSTEPSGVTQARATTPDLPFPATASSAGTVNIVDARGVAHSIPVNQLEDAFRQGYRVETPSERALRKTVEDNDNFSGSVKQFGKQFINQALMGVPGVIQEYTADPWQQKVNQKLKEQDQIANALGGITGFGASLFIGSPLFKGASVAGQLVEKAVAGKLAQAGIARGSESLASSIVAHAATGAAKLGVEGAIVSTPHAVTEAALGDPDAAAESLLIGGGLGAFLGVAGAPLARSLKGLNGVLSRKAEEAAAAGTEPNALADFFENMRDSRAAKALGFSKAQIKKLKGGWEEAKGVSGYLFDRAMPDGKPLIGPTTSREGILDNLYNFKDHAGEQIGGAYQRLDEAGVARIDTPSLIEAIDAKLGKYFRSPLNKGEVTIYENLKEAIRARGEKEITFSGAKDLLDEIGTVAFPRGKMPINPTEKQLAALDGWHILKAEIDQNVEKTASLLKDSSLKNDLFTYRKDYNHSLKAIKALENEVSAHAGNKLFGLTDTITGVGAALANPLYAIPTVLAKKAMEKYGNQISANLLDKVKDGIFVADDAMSQVRTRLDEIPGLFKGYQSKESAFTPTSAKGQSALQRFLDTPEKSKRKALEELQEKLPTIISNPDYAVNTAADLVSPLSRAGAPSVANSLVEKAKTSVQYLYESMPKPQPPASPFHQPPTVVSDQDLASFERKAEIVYDPFKVFDYLSNGTLNKDHVEALSVNYPLLYQAIRTRVINEASTQKPNMSYSRRLKLSLLMGMDIDGTTKGQNILSYQNSFMPNKQMAQNQIPSGLNAQGLMELDVGKRSLTNSQRMLAKN